MRVPSLVLLLAACTHQAVDPVEDEEVLAAALVQDDLHPSLPQSGRIDLGPPEAHTQASSDAFFPELSAYAHPNHPLLILVEAHCEPDCDLEITVNGPGVVRRVIASDGAAPHQRVVVPGLRQSSPYEVSVVANGVYGERFERSYTVMTGALDFVPPSRKVTTPGPLGGVLLTAGNYEIEGTNQALYMAIDNEGYVVWFHHFPSIATMPPQIRQREDGTFLLLSTSAARIVDIEGNIKQRFWERNGDGTWHHDATETPDGNLLAMVEEDLDVGTEGEPLVLIGDGVAEYNRHNHIEQYWSSVETLDTERFPGPLARMEIGHLRDWTHGNAVTMLPDGKRYAVSLRHQSHVVVIDRETAEIEWILGEGGDFDLMVGTWFNAQHDPSFLDGGEVLVYDNGTERHECTKSAADFGCLVATAVR